LEASFRVEPGQQMRQSRVSLDRYSEKKAAPELSTSTRIPRRAAGAVESRDRERAVAPPLLLYSC